MTTILVIELTVNMPLDDGVFNIHSYISDCYVTFSLVLVRKIVVPCVWMWMCSGGKFEYNRRNIVSFFFSRI